MSESALSYRSSSPSRSRRGGWARPSLVILSGDSVVTPFMKKRYNPTEFVVPKHVFGQKTADQKKQEEEEREARELERQKEAERIHQMQIELEKQKLAHEKQLEEMRQREEEARARKQREENEAKKRRIQELARQVREEDRIKREREEEEARKHEEEKLKKEAERQQKEAEKRRRLEEEAKKIEEEKRRIELEKQKLEEEQRRTEEERQQREREERENEERLRREALLSPSKDFGEINDSDTNIDLDNVSIATSAFSEFTDDDKFEETIQKQLDFDAAGTRFPEMFGTMKPEERRRLGRVARLQTVQKKNWIESVWKLFDPTFSQKGLWLTLHAITSDDDTLINGLLGSVKRACHKFIRARPTGTEIFMKAIVTGPKFSGKTTFMRTMFIYTLSVLASSGSFKNLFIVSLDGRNKDFSSKENFYKIMVDAVVNALLAQRLDVGLFAHSLHKAFSTLLTAPVAKKLPKPISSQDYLRRPMKQVDILLTRLHTLYNDNNEESFLEQVASLPKTIADIFGFSSSFVLFDHIDATDIDIGGHQLFEYVKIGLNRSQFLISGMNCSKLIDSLDALYIKSSDLNSGISFIDITGSCGCQSHDKTLEVTFMNKEVPALTLTPAFCGGCPTFTSRFDDICNIITEYDNMEECVRKQELMIIASTRMEILLDLVTSFGKYQEKDGGPPKVEHVKFA